MKIFKEKRIGLITGLVSVIVIFSLEWLSDFFSFLGNIKLFEIISILLQILIGFIYMPIFGIMILLSGPDGEWMRAVCGSKEVICGQVASVFIFVITFLLYFYLGCFFEKNLKKSNKGDRHEESRDKKEM